MEIQPKQKCPLFGRLRVGLLAGLVLALWVGARALGQTTCTLSQIHAEQSWVPPYWGQNAPKLVFDGEAWYTLGFWGPYGSSTGAVYKYQNGTWTEGLRTANLDYQPGMLLLDNQKRLIVIYPRVSTPLILRSAAKGDIHNFSPLTVSSSIGFAGYMGAGIYQNRLVIGYIGAPETYSFNMAWLDLDTNRWHGPYLLARADRDPAHEPNWVTWLYPIVQPDAGGVHLVVSNNPDHWSRYNRVYYMYEPYSGGTPTVETVAPADTARDWIVFGQSMWHTSDGTLYVCIRYAPTSSSPNELLVCRRDPVTRYWTQTTVSSTPYSVDFQHGAVFQQPGDPGRLWLAAAYATGLRLYTSTDRGDHWAPATLPSFTSYSINSAGYLYRLDAFNGSQIGNDLWAVFCEGVSSYTTGTYKLWLARFQFTTPTPTPTPIESGSRSGLILWSE